MFGDTITLDFSPLGSSSPREKTLKKINQDGYSSEYRLKESDVEHVLIIRHTTEKARVRGKAVDRHNVVLTTTYFPTELSPQGEVVQAYSVIRVAPERPTADTTPQVNAVMRFTSENGENIVGWES